MIDEDLMTHILLIGDNSAQGEQLAQLPRSSGCVVTRVGDGDEALERLQLNAPDIVLIDLDTSENDGRSPVKSIHKAYPSLPIILMTSFGADHAASALRQGGTGYIRKRAAARELIRTVANVLTVARLLSEKMQALDSLKDVEFNFLLDNDIAHIPPLLSCIELVASALHPCDPMERMRVNMALNEALLNAVQHGNLELSSELRQENEDHFRDLGDERRNLMPYMTRRTTLQATLSRGEAVYVVQDDGNGFDPTKVADATDDENLHRVGGRGLLLMKSFMDTVEFNAKGNRTTLRKRYPTADCPID